MSEKGARDVKAETEETTKSMHVRKNTKEREGGREGESYVAYPVERKRARKPPKQYAYRVLNNL